MCLYIVDVCTSCFYFFKQKSAYEMRISDWSSDVCSSDLLEGQRLRELGIGEGVSIETLHHVGIGAEHWQILCRAPPADARFLQCDEIGRASCRERVCQDV